MQQKRVVNQEAIIAEYLTGGYSFRQLGEKHGIDFRKIHGWVSKYQGKIKSEQKLIKGAINASSSDLPTDVKKLQAELRKAQLHTEVLEEMLRLSETLTGIELRKKFGARRF